jgi:Tfp pilus assembly protein PilN
MRPVNLIPPESRRGHNAPLRSGPLPYIAIGALVAVLLGVTLLVLTGNEISESKANITKLEAENSVAVARVEKLAAFTKFRNMREQRVATVTSLANSRFDWQRVMRELALILPDEAWLTEMTASASAEANVEGAGSGGGLRKEIPGPALELTGCAAGQEAVARFVTDLKDIDGVTRVAVTSSELPSKESLGGGSNASSGDCRTRNFIALFHITVAFDAAPVPVSSAAASLPSATEQAQTTSEKTESEGSTEKKQEG